MKKEEFFSNFGNFSPQIEEGTEKLPFSKFCGFEHYAMNGKTYYLAKIGQHYLGLNRFKSYDAEKSMLENLNAVKSELRELIEKGAELTITISLHPNTERCVTRIFTYSY